MPDVSIIIPVYNAQRYLRRCLDSIVSQDIESLEIILVNDGSTDDSLDICRRYAQKDARIHIVSQGNQGAAAARNTGILAATGLYIIFIDADDRISPGYCQKLLATAQECAADIAFSNICRMGNEGIVNTSHYSPGPRTTLPERLALLHEEYYPAPWGKVYHGDLIRKNSLTFLVQDGYSGFAEDILFALHTAYSAGKIVLCEDATYIYHNDNADSLCANPARIAINNKDRLIIIDKMLSFVVENKFSEEACEPVLHAVENHLRWGGEQTRNAFMQTLESRGYPRAIENFFRSAPCGKTAGTAGRHNFRERIKHILEPFPALYAIAARIYRGVCRQ